MTVSIGTNGPRLRAHVSDGVDMLVVGCTANSGPCLLGRENDVALSLTLLQFDSANHHTTSVVLTHRLTTCSILQDCTSGSSTCLLAGPLAC